MDSEEPYSLINRTFSRLSPSGVRWSIFALSSSLMSAGTLLLPFALFTSGIVLGMFLFSLIVLLSGWFYTFIVRGCERHSLYNVGDLLMALYGPWMRCFQELSSALLSFGVVCLYMVIVSRMTSSSLVSSGVLLNEGEGNLHMGIVFALSLCVWLPLILLGELPLTHCNSVLSAVTCGYIVCAVLIESPLYIRENADLE